MKINFLPYLVITYSVIIVIDIANDSIPFTLKLYTSMELLIFMKKLRKELKY